MLNSAGFPSIGRYGNVSECINLHILQPDVPNHTFKTFINILLSVTVGCSLTIVSLHGSFLLVIWKHKNLRTKANLLLMMLALPDLLIGLVALPLYGHLVTSLREGVRLCRLAYFLNMGAFILSVMSIVVIIFIAGDLYLSVSTPFFYRNQIHKKTMFSALATVWSVTASVGVSFTILCYYTTTYYWISFQFYTGVLITVIMIHVALVYLIIRREIKKILTQAALAMQMSYVQSHQKMTLIMCMVVLAFILCDMPYILTGMYKMLHRGEMRYGTAKLLEYYVQLASGLLALTKPIWNAFIYYFRLKSIRTCIWRTFFSKTRIHPVAHCSLKALKLGKEAIRIQVAEQLR